MLRNTVVGVALGLIGAVTTRRRRETVVLRGHVGQQVPQGPSRAWGGEPEVEGRDRGHDVDGGMHGDVVLIGKSRHT